MAANSAPGSDSSHGSTPPEAKRASDASPSAALLVHGARAALSVFAKRTDRLSTWTQALIARRGYKKAIVALAAKNARIAWAVLASGKTYAPSHTTKAAGA